MYARSGLRSWGTSGCTLVLLFGSGGTSECTLVPVFGIRRTSAKTTLLETTLFQTPDL